MRAEIVLQCSKSIVHQGHVRARAGSPTSFTATKSVAECLACPSLSAAVVAASLLGSGLDCTP